MHWTIREMILVRLLPSGEHSLVRNISKKRKRVWDFYRGRKTKESSLGLIRVLRKDGKNYARGWGAKAVSLVQNTRRWRDFSMLLLSRSTALAEKLEGWMRTCVFIFFWVRSLGTELLSDV